MTINASRLSSRQAGYSLIEALTALLVTAFGMLAIAGLHVTLSQNSDVAKQRSEAVRLAQLKMEELRAFEQVASDGAGNKFDYTADVVSGNDTVTPTAGYSNASFARTWTVTGSGTDPQKWIRVAVSWTDRSNSTQTVSLQSVIARADPVDIGTLAVGPGPSKPRSPKNRNVDIPYPAVSLAGDKSGFAPGSTGTPFYIFDNVTGEVLGSCVNALSENSAVNFGDGNCTAFPERRYLLSGYIRFVAGNFNLSDFVNPAGPARDLTAAVVLNVGAGADCYTQRQKVVSAGSIAAPRNINSATRVSNTVTVVTAGNHGFSAGQFVSINGANNVSFNGVFKLLTASGNTFTYTHNAADGSFSGGSPPSTATLVQEIIIPETQAAPPGYNAVTSTFVAYTCVMTPVDDDTNPSTPNRWWGKFQIAPSGSPAWTLGTVSGTHKLCRYTGDYVVDGQVSNSEHPLYYHGVSGVLDNQNYVVIDGHRNCPTDSAANPITGKYTNVNTTVHQTDVSGIGGERSGTNGGGGAAQNGGFASAEPVYSTSVALPMY